LAPTYFGNEFSRSWWNFAKAEYAKGEGEQFVATIDAAIKVTEPDRQKRLIEALQKAAD
jgi:hypothetical protein